MRGRGARAGLGRREHGRHPGSAAKAGRDDPLHLTAAAQKIVRRYGTRAAPIATTNEVTSTTAYASSMTVND